VTLTPGERLGPYEIVSPLGAGGMGEVYRARDTRLQRSVAVKVLPQHLSSSPAVRQRFEREAKTISQLSHPHICALYDVGRDGETEYLVMELLEGETLSDRLARGALPIGQTLRYGADIADALDKAHRQAIVHRDLKPGNVMLTKSGVKLLDFGLAKALPSTGGKEVGGNGLSALPTQQGLTQERTILGTFQYMAPEQLEGKEVDHRTDIFALGVVLYEMATGRKAFSGSTQASLVSAILRDDPPPISKLEPMSPPAFDRVVTTCLAKDQEDRWQSARDVASELRWIAEGSQAGIPVAAPRRPPWLPWTIAAAAVIAAGMIAAGVMAFSTRRPTAPAPQRMEFSIVASEPTVLSEFLALSPDGRTLAFAAIAGGKSLLRVRDLASNDVRVLPGTDTPESVFWSPDSRSLGFVSRGKLRRIEVATGSIEVLADAGAGRGGSWGVRDDILFARKAAGAIYRVAASGGPVTPVTSFEKGDLMHRWPQVLPDGKRFLFFVKTGNPETTGTYLASIGAPGRKLVLRNGATGVFAPPDTLLFGRSSVLLAQRFDPDRGQLLGAPETVTRPLLRAELASFEDLVSVSETDILVYRPGSAERRLTWVDRRGNVLRQLGTAGVITSVTLAPGDREAAVSMRVVETGNYTTAIVDLDRDVLTPFADLAATPIWAPDGRTIFYRHEGSTYEIWKRAAHGDLRESSIGVADSFAMPHAISLDGRYLLFTRMGGNFDVGVKDLRGGPPEILLGSEFDERYPHFSPDGRWFVYSSDEPGQTEIFARRFPMTEETWRISTSGGRQPSWSRDGKEIFFLDLDDRLMAAPVSAASTLSVGAPQTLFRTTLRLDGVANQYAVSADGQRFLMAVPTRDVDREPFRVLLNWRTKR
jgi:serine/threonine protein kinase